MIYDIVVQPYHTIVSIRQLVDTIKQHLTPERDDYIKRSALLQDDRLWSLMQSCWEANPETRPTMDQVVEKLKAMQSASMILDDEGSSKTHHVALFKPVEHVVLHDASSPANDDWSKETNANIPGPSKKGNPFSRIFKAIAKLIS